MSLNKNYFSLAAGLLFVSQNIFAQISCDNTAGQFAFKNLCYEKVAKDLCTPEKSMDSLIQGNDCYLPVERSAQKPVAVNEAASWGTPLNTSNTAINQVMSTVNVKPSEDSYNKDQCLSKNGFYTSKGLCISASVFAEFGFNAESERYGGGNEKQMGQGAVVFDASISQKLYSGPLSSVGIEVSIVPKDQVNDYAETLQMNYHNANRFRSDGYLDRPWFLGSLVGNIDYSLKHKGQIRLGMMQTNGLAPLEGKPSAYYLSGPYALTVRYDKGIKIDDVWLNSELKQYIKTSFAVVHGDTVKGQSGIVPDDSRSNSYPSFAFSAEASLSTLAEMLAKGLTKKGIDLSKYNIYIGFTGAKGDTGSNPGQKRRQNDLITYAGVATQIGKGTFEVRVFNARYERNPEGAVSNGKEDPAVISVGRGIEMAYRGYSMDKCDASVYAAVHEFKNTSDKADGEFTYNQLRSIKGFTIGASCDNFLGVKGLKFSFEAGRLKLDSPESANAVNPSSGAISYRTVLSYKFNAL